MSEQRRVIYTKEELAAKVKVPAIVEQDLKLHYQRLSGTMRSVLQMLFQNQDSILYGS